MSLLSISSTPPRPPRLSSFDKRNPPFSQTSGQKLGVIFVSTLASPISKSANSIWLWNWRICLLLISSSCSLLLPLFTTPVASSLSLSKMQMLHLRGRAWPSSSSLWPDLLLFCLPSLLFSPLVSKLVLISGPLHTWVPIPWSFLPNHLHTLTFF